MQFRIPLFLWFSSLMAGLIFIIVGFKWPELISGYGSAAAGRDLSEEELNMIFEGWINGLKALGGMMIICSTVLFLMRKKLSTLAFSGIFAILMIACVLAASYIAIQ